MNRWGFLFPGQGSQAVGMGKALVEEFAVARLVFEEVHEALGMDLLTLCLEGPEEALRLTENTQPAVLAVSTAAARVLHDELEIAPLVLAGHSLGEFSALVQAGALTLTDAVKIVRERGRLMQQAVPENLGGMAAVMGMSGEEIEAICAQAAQGEICSAANFNSPEQIVISGHQTAVERAREQIRTLGKRAIALQVSAPFHCALMQPAADGLAEVLKHTDIHPMKTPIISNVDALAYQTPDVVCQRLLMQVTSPVRWVESIQTMLEMGVSHFIEVGHGRVLAGLGRRISRETPTLPMGQPKDLEKIAGLLSLDT